MSTSAPDSVIEARVLAREELIKPLVLSWFKFQHTIENGTAEESQKAYDTLCTRLDAYEFSLDVDICYLDAREQDRVYYDEQLQHAQAEIDALTKELEGLRSELEVAMETRRQRQEYDVLTRMINEHPTRAKTQAEIDAVDAQIAELKAKSEAVDRDLSARSKQFQLLLFALQQLQTTLSKGDNDDGDDDDDDDDARVVDANETDQQMTDAK